MTEQVKHQICIEFCVTLEHSSARTIKMIQKGRGYRQLVIGSFITTMHPLMHHHVSCRVFWWNIKSPRWLCPPTAHIWHPATSGFSQNSNYLWNGRDFRSLLKRFGRIQQGSWWWLGKLCEVPRCLLWRGLRHHCLMYNVSCVFYLLLQMSLFFILHGWKPSRQTSYIWYHIYNLLF